MLQGLKSATASVGLRKFDVERLRDDAWEKAETSVGSVAGNQNESYGIASVVKRQWLTALRFQDRQVPAELAVYR
jgi:hypothetical protein